MVNTIVMQNASSFGPVVIEVALLLCTQRVGERYPVGPPFDVTSNLEFDTI